MSETQTEMLLETKLLLTLLLTSLIKNEKAHFVVI